LRKSLKKAQKSEKIKNHTEKLARFVYFKKLA
jgi:hypothetical protein